MYHYTSLNFYEASQFISYFQNTILIKNDTSVLTLYSQFRENTEVGMLQKEQKRVLEAIERKKGWGIKDVSSRRRRKDEFTLRKQCVCPK